MSEQEKERMDAWRRAMRQHLIFELRTRIRPYTATQLTRFCVNNDKYVDDIVDLALTEFLIRQGL